MPNLGTNLDSICPDAFIITAVAYSAYCQLSVQSDQVEATEFLTTSCEYCHERTPCSVGNPLRLFRERGVPEYIGTHSGVVVLYGWYICVAVSCSDSQAVKLWFGAESINRLGKTFLSWLKFCRFSEDWDNEKRIYIHIYRSFQVCLGNSKSSEASNLELCRSHCPFDRAHTQIIFHQI